MNRIALLLFAMIAAVPAWAGFRAYNGNTDLDIFDSIKCNTGITCTRVAGKLNMASSLIKAQITSTTTTLTSAACGSTIVSDSADVVTLPEASTVLGCQLRFVCGVAANLDVNPNDATDVIGNISVITGTNTAVVLAPAAGDAVRCAAIGGSLTLEAVGANLWAVQAVNGVWTDVN